MSVLLPFLFPSTLALIQLYPTEMFSLCQFLSHFSPPQLWHLQFYQTEMFSSLSAYHILHSIHKHSLPSCVECEGHQISCLQSLAGKDCNSGEEEGESGDIGLQSLTQNQSRNTQQKNKQAWNNYDLYNLSVPYRNS